MIEIPAAQRLSQSPLRWSSVSQVPLRKNPLAQKTLAPPAKPPSVPNNISSTETKQYSYIQWETDAAHCDLNEILIRAGSLPSSFDFLDALKLLAHKNPKLRILQLGNDQDETMQFCLEALRTNYDERLYSSYTLATTSLDTAFRAKMTSKAAFDVDVVLLDIDQQPQNQVPQNGAYDLIVITDFSFAARANLTAWVDRLRYLINPLGYIFCLPNFAGSSTSKDQDFMSSVHTDLCKVGFVFGAGDDAPSDAPKAIAELRKPPKHAKRVTLVAPGDDHRLVDEVLTSFQQSGISCDRCKVEEDIPQGQDMIWVADFSEPYLYNMTEARFRDFTQFISRLKGSMIWVTPLAQISCNNPNSAMTIGMARTLRAEMKKDITVVEIATEPSTFSNSSKSVVKIYQKLNCRAKSKFVDPDYEYAIVDGDIKVSRVHWTTGKNELSQCPSSLKPKSNDMTSPPGPDRGLPSPIRFRSDACYILVGGLGGLGRVISIWMVENGARNILFLSRSAKEGPETTPFFEELRDRGCEVQTSAGNVTYLSDVEDAIKQATRPVAGVMQMSAVMRVCTPYVLPFQSHAKLSQDNWMSHMTFSEWKQCVQPKVQGTWNLHHATSSATLDFFLLFSSICGLSGQWGQANYNSANTFLDAFVNYRHSLELPASVVDIGFMGSVGMAVENKALVEKLTAGGYYFLGEKDLFDALTIAIAHSRSGSDPFMNTSQLGLGLRSSKPITDASTRVVWKKDARMVLSHQLGSLTTKSDDKAES